jgi:hypothetical protein
MEVDYNSQTRQRTARAKIQYLGWQQSRVKWPLYLKNKHNSHIKMINVWDKIIIENLLPGPTIAWDCGGLYLAGLIDDLIVAETRTCPRWVSDKINIVDDKVDMELRQVQAKNLISVQNNTLKYNHSIYDYLIRAGWSNQGWKPALLPWMHQTCRIFLSISDFMLYYNRLKYTKEEFVERQTDELKAQGFAIDFCKIQDAGSHMINGNIKLILSRANNG